MEKLSCKRTVLPNHLVSVIRGGNDKRKSWFRTGEVATGAVDVIESDLQRHWDL